MHNGSSQLSWRAPGLAFAIDEPPPLAGVGPAWLRALARRATAGRPAIAWSLALLFVFKGLISLAAVAFPISAREPTVLVGAAGAVAFVGGFGVWLFAARIPPRGFELLAACGSLMISFLIAHARTHGGMMIAAFAYPWVAIYAAHFFPRRAVYAQAVLISVAFALALALGGLPHVAIYWLVVTVTIWSICILLGDLSEALRREIGTDHLTGLLNRSGFMAAALRERSLANRTGAPLAIAVIDLDDFKQVNDRAGHAAGDKLLARLGRQWRERMRPSDILARHGGDEFVLLLPGTGTSGAQAALERLCSGEDPVSWSTGVSEWLPDEGLETALARADKQLYEAKLGAGRGRDRERAAPALERA
jgi:diguanylate cyclase (GGDEF)-like protein